MTYAGFKTYVYAELPRTDQRVTAAYDWIRRNYSVSENPGMGPSGMYYYYVVFARGLEGVGRADGETALAGEYPDRRGAAVAKRPDRQALGASERGWELQELGQAVDGGQP